MGCGSQSQKSEFSALRLVPWDVTEKKLTFLGPRPTTRTHFHILVYNGSGFQWFTSRLSNRSQHYGGAARGRISRCLRVNLSHLSSMCSPSHSFCRMSQRRRPGSCDRSRDRSRSRSRDQERSRSRSRERSADSDSVILPLQDEWPYDDDDDEPLPPRDKKNPGCQYTDTTGGQEWPCPICAIIIGPDCREYNMYDCGKPFVEKN